MTSRSSAANAGRAGRAWVLLLACAGLFFVAAPALADGPWKKVSESDGIKIERREVSGTSFHELRAIAHTKASVDAVLDAVWSGVFEDLPPAVRSRKPLKREAQELLFYDQIAAPLVSDRDFTLRMWRADGPPAGAEEVLRPGMRWLRFETANALGPPPQPGHVRVQTIRGAWGAAPDGNGGTQLVYMCYSEPGGQIPAWIARGAQKDQFLVDLRRILRRSVARGH